MTTRVYFVCDTKISRHTPKDTGRNFEPSDLYWCVHPHLLKSRSPFWICDHKLTFHFQSRPSTGAHSSLGFGVRGSVDRVGRGCAK
jgi:hypothetical protein